MMKYFVTVSIILLFFVNNLEAQRTARFGDSNWDRYRTEFVYGVGTSFFMGDLGGGEGPGKHFMGLSDLDWDLTRPSLHFGVRYRFTEYFAVKGNLSYGRVLGDDAETSYEDRQKRNLNFKSNIYELSIQAEISLLTEHRSRFYHFRRNVPSQNFNIYLFAGIGGFHFNPKAETEENETVELQPLGTEGQGLPQQPNYYSLYEIAIPLGLGMRYYLSENYSVGFEAGIRYTTTDYIDDCSTVYFDNDLIREYNGDLAAEMADRREGAPYPAGGQRGDAEHTDSYTFTMVTLTYSMRSNNRNRSKFRF